MTRTKFSSNINVSKKQEVKVSEKEKTPCCEDLVDALIANERSPFTAEDKEYLLTLKEDRLKAFIPEKEKIPAPEVLEKEGKKDPAEKVVTDPKPEDGIELLSVEDKEALAYGRKQLKERREKMIKGIQDNAGKDVWPDETLSTMDEDTLERVFKSVSKEEVVDYSALASSGITGNEQEHLLPAGVGPQYVKEPADEIK